MTKYPGLKKNITMVGLFALVAVLILSACAPAPTAAPPTVPPVPTTDPAVIQTQAVQTAVADMTAAAPPPATEVPPPPAGPTPDPNLPVAVFPTPAAGEPGAIADYNTAIFSGPGTNYVVYGAMNGGVTAKVVGKSEDSLWWAVSVPVAPGGNGWVSDGYVTVSNVDGVPVLPTPPVPPTVELVPPGSSDPQATTIANVYVRSGPGGNYPAYGIAPTGMTGRVIGKSEDNQWWVVRLDPAMVGLGYGWVEMAYTQAINVENVQTIETPPSSETAPPPPPPAGVPTVTALDYVNVRSGPGDTYPVLVVAPTGASGEVTGKSADAQWWQVKISTDYSADGLGWVSAYYVYPQNVDSVPVVDAPAPPPTVEATPPPASTVGCLLAQQTPADGTAVNISEPFDTTWVIQNTGSEAWDQDGVDIGFVGAYNNVYLHTGADVVDLTNTVEPGWTYNVTVPMMGPSGPGDFGEMWQVQKSGEVICQFYAYVVVN